jgi:hypothetical protein
MFGLSGLMYLIRADPCDPWLTQPQAGLCQWQSFRVLSCDFVAKKRGCSIAEAASYYNVE